MNQRPFLLLISLLLLEMIANVQAASMNKVTGPSATMKVFTRMTVLGISEGVLFGTTVDNAGESIGFTSDTTATNDTLYSIVNLGNTQPTVYEIRGDFQSANNIPTFPKNHSRFTEIRGYSQGIIVGNYASANGSRAFVISTNETISILSVPGAKPYSTTITGISQGIVVGDFVDHVNGIHGFSYSITNGNFGRIDDPEGMGRTRINGISEGVIFGSFVTAKGITDGFGYGNSTYTKITAPEAAKFTEVTGYSQGVITGNFIDSNRVTHGFSYNGNSGSNYDDPYDPVGYLRFSGYENGVIVGNEYDTNGFMDNFIEPQNIANQRPVFITTYYWETTLGNYPLHPTSKPPIKYIPPVIKGGK